MFMCVTLYLFNFFEVEIMGKKVLAFDFGASSGRTVMGDFDGKKMSLTELHRFSNDPVMLGDTFYWDLLRLFHDIKLGISKSVHTGNKDIVSMGIDTWGVDFGLLDIDGKLLENPVHYRDKRTSGIQDEVFKVIPRDTLYNKTGIQFMDINTIFQLYYMATKRRAVLDKAETMLHMPDLFNYFLTGNKVTEYSIASTGQMLNPYTGDWDLELISKLNIPNKILMDIVNPGTKVGSLIPSICGELGASKLDVYAVAGHDTASAIAAVPAKEGENYAYLSCGTWSLLGIESDKPIVNKKSLHYNYTNEGGYGRKIRFLKNICGLWLMQECRRQWAKEGDSMSFKDIDKLTIKSSSLQRFINPDYAPFALPGDMPARIAEYCIKTGQTPPQSKGEVARCITESLALKYRYTIEELEIIKGSKIDVIHIIGGGVQDKLLCQYTANATKKTVIAGPIEATALGNVAVQLISCGEFSNLEQAREVISKSFPLDIYEPQDISAWDTAYEKYLKILNIA
jgi:rhamnulokinase